MDLLTKIVRELQKSPLGIPKLKPRPCHFLNLPLELRLHVYSFLTPGYSSFSRPLSHPLYPLLHVCHRLRDDTTYLFYHSAPAASFTFFTLESCTFFLQTTASQTSLITELELHLPATKTSSLEPIFRKLYLARAPLRSLNIHLIPEDGRFHPRERIVTAYMLPRRITLNEDGIRKAAGSVMNKEDFIFADTHSCLAVRLAEENKTVLRRCGDKLRQLRVLDSLRM